jgi:hypothetical protein
MSNENQTIWEKLSNLPEQYIYLVLALTLIVPLLNPLGLPIPISFESRNFYNAIEALEPGDVVFFAFDAGSMTWMEQGLGAEVVMKHILSKPGVKIVGATIGPEGPMFWEQTINKFDPSRFDKTYGDDIVWLGFFAGGETSAAALARDIKDATAGVDYYGNSLDGLALMDDVNSAVDFEMLVCLSWGGTWSTWMNQWQMPYGIEEYVIPLAGVVAEMRPYIQSGQISSIINGARGAAEYELLRSEPGRAVAGMDAQSIGHIYVAILIIVGNIAAQLSRGRRT